jgi:hypothetical protein
MNLEYRHLLDAGFADDSRVWIYQSNRLFTMTEAFRIEELLNDFTANWLSHGSPVKGAAYLLFGQFIVLMADERATGVSGCSTDSSVRLIKNIERDFSVNLFDRTMLAFHVKDKIQLLPVSQLQYGYDNGFIDRGTVYFNNTVQTKKELEENWIVALKDSWLTRRISFSDTIS